MKNNEKKCETLQLFQSQINLIHDVEFCTFSKTSQNCKRKKLHTPNKNLFEFLANGALPFCQPKKKKTNNTQSTSNRQRNEQEKQKKNKMKNKRA